MGKDKHDVTRAPLIAQHRKKLGDREKFDTFDRKAPRTRLTSRTGKRDSRGGAALSGWGLALVVSFFLLFVASAGYLIVVGLLPPKELST